MYGFYKPLPPSHRMEKKKKPSSNSDAKSSSSKSRPSTAVSSKSRPATAVTQVSTEVIEPSIDGPPSPERIRAYTEQMKMNPAFVNQFRDYDRSTSASLKSATSGGSADGARLSRTSSQQSKASSKTKGDRPESVIGKMFSRTAKKSRKEVANLRSISSLSNHPESAEDVSSPMERLFSSGKISRRGTLGEATKSAEDVRKQISGPYNFQHVTHTQQDHLPNLDVASPSDLVSEFTAIRASQAPSHGHLRGIRTNDIHSEDLFSEHLDAAEEIRTRPRSNSRKSINTLKKAPSAARPRPRLAHAQSHESLRGPAPPRPPRSPLEAVTPYVVPPPRTSSRTASMVWDNFDPLATTSLTRPSPNTHFRTSQAFHLPISPPRPMVRSEQESDFIIPTGVSMPNSPADAWPLASPFQLADVKEEEEESFPVRSRPHPSRIGGSIRHSRSVPDFHYRPESPEAAITPHQDENGYGIGVAVSPTRQSIRLAHEAWEDDIDYCYEHEADADFEYEWDRCSFDDGTQEPSIESIQQLEQRHSQAAVASPERPSRFRESFLVPSAYDIPELSPMSPNAGSGTPSPDPRTPSLMRPSLLRSPSQASSFKESHGFTLSPSLLIPVDFAHQMHANEDAYNSLHEHATDNGDGLDLARSSSFINDPISPMDESRSSTASYSASYRSSGFSRTSHSTAASTSNGMSISGSVNALKKSGSQESVILLSRAASVARAHRSISVSSTNELGTLLAARGSKPDLSVNADETRDILEEDIEALAGPVADMNMSSDKKASISHGRKTSAPLLSNAGTGEGKREIKGRTRSSSAAHALTSGSTKPRGSYMLFPQV